MQVEAQDDRSRLKILYVFYPYFWSKKEDWLTLAQIDDTDPLFAKFLQAGAARVQLPVRLGFEKSILHYLELGEIWNGEGLFVNTANGEANPLHVSVLEELKGNAYGENLLILKHCMNPLIRH